MSESVVVLLPGDGVGAEVLAEARRVLEAVLASSDLDLRFDEALIGGAAIDAEGTPLPEATLEAHTRHLPRGHTNHPLEEGHAAWADRLVDWVEP